MNRLLKGVAAGIVILAVSLCGCELTDEEDYDISGAWTFTLTYPDGAVEVWVMSLTQSGDGVTGTSHEQGDAQTVAVSGSVDGDSVSLTEDWPGGEPDYTYSGKIKSDSSMNGSAKDSTGGNASTWTAQKN